MLDSTCFHAESSQSSRALRPRVGIDRRVDAVAAAVHRYAQRTEAAHPELPQAFRMQIVEIDVLDCLHPCRFERGRASDDRQVRAAELSERGERSHAQAALAD